MTLIILVGLLSTAAFVVLWRLLWLRGKSSGPAGIILLAGATLIVGLAVLTATGRLHWLAAIGAAVFPFAKRAVGWLRWLPIIRKFYQTRAGPTPQPRTSSVMSKPEAADILGLGSNPSKAEITSAHRRLMQRLHPDRGGSTHLAQQLNEARRVLLEDS